MTPFVLAGMAALSAAGAVALGRPLHSRALRRLLPMTSGDERPTRSAPSWLSTVGVVTAGVAVASSIRGVFGLAVGVAVVIALNRWLSALPRAQQIERRRHRAAELPVVTDLLGACLASGAPVLRSIQVVGATARSGLRTDLARVAAALEMGASPGEAWAMVAGTDLDSLSSVMRRSAETGAPAAALLLGLANELRSKIRSAALSDARGLGVRAAGPLGLCFLPAFILIGVVPLVLSLVQAWA